MLLVGFGTVSSIKGDTTREHKQMGSGVLSEFLEQQERNSTPSSEVVQELPSEIESSE
ncbi:hypothetical protein RJF_3688 [Candidozyma auris]|nr:hypothetical protein QG37_07551 [[Candida] auris]